MEIGDGFLANRSRVPFNLEMNLLIEDGALPQDVDKVMYDFGYPMGPFAVADLAGNDIGWEGRKRRYAADPDARKLPIPDTICEMGRFWPENPRRLVRLQGGRPHALSVGRRREDHQRLPGRSRYHAKILHRGRDPKAYLVQFDQRDLQNS